MRGEDDSERQYPKRLSVRASESELAEIHVRAKRSRLSASRYLVASALKGRPPPIREALPPNAEDRAHIEWLMAEIRKVGLNLDQLARRSNRARLGLTAAPRFAEVESAAGLVGRLLRLLGRRL